MEMEKLPVPDFCPCFSICSHILRYLLTPWEKNCLTFRTTNNRKKRIFFNLFFLLKGNRFTDFCCFPSNLKMRQPQVNIYPLPFEPPSHLLPIPSLQVDMEPLFEFIEPYSKFQLAIYFTNGNVSFHVTLSIHLTFSFPFPMSISLFSISISPFLPCK